MKKRISHPEYIAGFKKMITTLILVGSGGLLAQTAAADASWITPDDDTLLVRWSQAELKPGPQTVDQSLSEIREHFSQAALPGESWRYDRIHVLMQTLEQQKSLPETDEVRYLNARLLQHRHQFREAATELLSVSQNSDYFASARLLLAQVYAEQGNYTRAREVCMTLVLVQADLAAGCTAASMRTPDEKVQGLLTALLGRYDDHTSATARELRHWFLYQKARGLLVSEQNLRVQQAYQRWADYDELPVADLVILTESMLLSSEPLMVIELLKPYGATRYPDDALLVQLARAENKLDDDSRYWQDYAERRIEERVRRQDASYSEIIALYFSTLGKKGETFEEWKESLSKTKNHHSERRFVAFNTLSSEGETQ